MISEEQMTDFKRHAVSKQHLNPETTLPDTVRKLRYLERMGIDLNSSPAELHRQGKKPPETLAELLDMVIT